ncbi:MAG: cell division protein FtsZ [Candidatus Nealsonbacteria bacterium]|nr:MAG: cell division protein FtsZ [Candidatus Nealsonbacteria bacterium]
MAKKLKKVIKLPLPKAETETIKKTKIRVIGIGGGAGNIVSEIASKVKKASFVVANTDLQALRSTSRKAQRFQFGKELTQGLGTGMSTELGEMAAQNEKEKIKKILEGQDLLIIVACLGGGTASGAAPIFAKISKNLGNLTLGIFTLPFKFEGEKKMEMARASLEKLKPKLNALSVIPNERIFQIIDKKTPIKIALSAINKSLAESLEGLIETIYQPGLINIDFADLKAILEGQGRLAYLNTVKVQKKGDSVQEVIEKVLNNPLYPYSIRGAKGVLLNIAGERDLELSEVNQISKTISELVNKDAKIIFGISQNKKYFGIIKTTLLATGCATKIFPKKPKKRRPKKKKIIEKAPLPEKPKAKTVKKAKKAKSASRRIKIKIQKESKEKGVSQPEVEEKKADEKVRPQPEAPSLGESESHLPATKEIHRKNALQIKKEAEEAEQDLLEKEKLWETPAFLRRQNKET